MSEQELLRNGPLYRRVGFMVMLEAGFNIGKTASLSKWAFAAFAEKTRMYQWRHCFWVRAWIRVLGVQVGAGFYYEPPQINTDGGWILERRRNP